MSKPYPPSAAGFTTSQSGALSAFHATARLACGLVHTYPAIGHDAVEVGMYTLDRHGICAVAVHPIPRSRA